MSEHEELPFVLKCRGPLTLQDALGTDRTPKNAKTCGLLALLAMSDGNKRARRWLETRLWSDRGQAQANGSLRQALTELRKCFGVHRAALITDRRYVALDRSMVTFDFGSKGDNTAMSLFEGLDVRDEEFEAWLTETRQRMEASPMEGPRATPFETPEVAALTPEVVSRLQVAVWPDPNPLSHLVADVVTQNLSELGGFELYATDLNSAPSSDLRLEVRTHQFDTASTVFMRLSNRVGQIAWSGSRPVDSKGLHHVLSVGNEVTEAVLRAAMQLEAAPPYLRLRERALDELFTFDAARLRVADGFLKAAEEQHHDPVVVGWRAFMRLVMINERTESDIATLWEEARALSRIAMSGARDNPTLIALISQIELFLGDVTQNTGALVDAAAQRNGTLVLAQTARATIALRRGDIHVSRQLCNAALQLSGQGRFAHWAHMVCCLADISAGDFNSATHHARQAHRMAPAFRMPLRHLYALEVDAGNFDEAARLLQILRTQTPEFSLQMIRETPEFPASTLRSSRLIENQDVST